MRNAVDSQADPNVERAAGAARAAPDAGAAATGPPPLSHLDDKGAARMVDVGAKPESHRKALASGEVRLQPATLRRLLEGRVAKGGVLEVARLAGIQAAKRAADWIPLCHPVRLTAVRVDFEPLEPDRIRVHAEVAAFDRTGVEMEALAAVAAAALTIYDMLKAVERGMVIGAIRLERKSGGRSGEYQRGAGGGA